MKILAVGDIVGKTGIQKLKETLPEVIKENNIDFVIVNGENSAEGMGLTEKMYREILDNKFELVSKYEPAGDQGEAIAELVDNIENGEKAQILRGATGTGKTYTMSQVIARTGKPTLVMAHNKTLAGQLYSEFKEFFPNNAVEYFVSY